MELDARPYLYVAAVSAAQGSEALDNPNPGPDIDFISSSSGGVESAPTNVLSSQAGPEGDSGNARSLESFSDAVLLQDTVVGGVCDLDAVPGYVSLGGAGGFVSVELSQELVTGDMITVYEIDSVYCTDAAAERPDSYEVYITNDPDGAVQSADPRVDWCLVGGQGGTGGVGIFTVNLEACAL